MAVLHGAAAVPSIVAIGLGNDLDSALLTSFSDTFLHIPDPGGVGPFMVNLLAATRATARVAAAADGPVDVTDGVGGITAGGTAGGGGGSAVANHVSLRLSPASAVAAVPGYPAAVVGDEVRVSLGSMLFDQPRDVIVVQPEGAPPLCASAWACDTPIAYCAAPTLLSSDTATAAMRDRFDAAVARTAAACALELQGQRMSIVDGLGAPKDEVAARLAREGGRFGDLTITLVWNDESDLDLHVFTPSDEELYYSNKKSRDGLCELDIDMNASMITRSKEPVENVFAGDEEKGIEAPRGKYRVDVINFAYHSSEGLPEGREIPFRVCVRMHGETTEYAAALTAAGCCPGCRTLEAASLCRRPRRCLWLLPLAAASGRCRDCCLWPLP